MPLWRRSQKLHNSLPLRPAGAPITRTLPKGPFLAPPLAAGPFFPRAPARMADPRQAMGPLGGPSMSGGQSRTFPVLSSTCNVPSSAQAYSLNFTAVPKGTLGYLTSWPTGQVQPLASTLNALTGAITANAGIIPAGSR